MYTVAENQQEISRSTLISEDVLRANYYENLDSRTISSLGFSKEIMLWNFVNSKRRFENSIDIQKKEYDSALSNHTNVLKSKLPIYFTKNKDKILSFCDEFEKKHAVHWNLINKHIDVLSDNISELNFNDIYLEITKSNLIKFTTLFDKDKILIISKDFTTDDNDIVFSYFINNQMIATDVFEISSFVKKFKEYISL